MTRHPLSQSGCSPGTLWYLPGQVDVGRSMAFFWRNYGCFMDVLWMFYGCFMDVLWMCYGCVMDVFMVNMDVMVNLSKSC